MDLQPYLDDISSQLTAAAAAGGDEARALAERLLAPLDAAIRLSLLEALSAAAQEISRELAPGSVEVRLRGRTPEFVVNTPPQPAANEAFPDVWTVEASATAGDDGATARINLRMPEQLKARVDSAAAAGGLSVNSWLIRVAAAALERPAQPPRPESPGQQNAQRFTGWART